MKEYGVLPGSGAILTRRQMSTFLRHEEIMNLMKKKEILKITRRIPL